MKFKNNGWSILTKHRKKTIERLMSSHIYSGDLNILNFRASFFANRLDPVSVCSIWNPVKSCLRSLCKEIQLIEMRWHLDVKSVFTQGYSLRSSGRQSKTMCCSEGRVWNHLITWVLSVWASSHTPKSKLFKMLKVWCFFPEFEPAWHHDWWCFMPWHPS